MEPKEVLQIWLDAYNNGDAIAVANLYDDHAINHQVAYDPVVGKTAIADRYADIFANNHVGCIPVNIFQDGEWTILEWKDPNGLRGSGFFHIRHDKIVLHRGYWDKVTLERVQNQEK
jgi:hypothetical protein